MQFQQQSTTRGRGINITSLIDVMFLLVIFLLLSTKFEPEGGIAVDLPKGQSKDVPKGNTLTLVVLHDGTLFLNREKVPEDPAGKALVEAISKAREGKQDPVMVIQADKDLPWQTIVKLTDMAKEAGQAKVNFKIKP